MDCYILHTVLLVIILLVMIAIICYHYEKGRSKLKKVMPHKINLKHNEFKTGRIKNRTSYYFNCIIKFEDFYYGNISIDHTKIY